MVSTVRLEKEPAERLSASPSRPAAEGISGRLPGVDGLRAVAALWVVLFHIHAFSGARLVHLPGMDFVLRSGSTGVSLFLVLSGFCLYIPCAGGRTDRFKVGKFLWRRCRRLMPAYYTSLVFAVALSVVAGATLGMARLRPLQLGWQVVTHVTLTHTLFPSSFYSLNGAYWSLGLEWQLYLALPLLIWGIRRFGLPATATAAIVCNVVYRLVLAAVIAHGTIPGDGVLATAVLPNQLPGRWAEFVFGMIAAELYATGRVAIWAHRLKFGLPALLAAGIVLMNSPLSHLIFGGIFFILLCLVLSADRVVDTVMSWPPLVGIGVMSYSLYLVHQPVVQVIAEVLRTRGHTTPNMTFFLLLLCVPFIVLLAWGLFMGVERWTLTSRRPASTVRAVRSLRLSTERIGNNDPAVGGGPAWVVPSEGTSS